MVILRSQNKITNFLIILAWASPFKGGCILVLFVCLFVRQQDCLQSNERGSMHELSSEMYLGPRNNLVHIRDDPDYDPDP